MSDFRLISDFPSLYRRSFELADPTLLDPNDTNPLLMGEFLSLNSSYKMARGSSSAIPSFCMFAEKGRSDIQAISKVPMLYLGSYEAETKIINTTSLVVNSPLMVGDVTYGGQTRRGLLLQTGSNFIVGYVTRTAVDGWVRFIRAD